MFFAKRFLLFLFIIMNSSSLRAQNKAIDVLHYHFEISLNDSNNIIRGKAGILFIPRQNANMIYLDLTGINDFTGKGMKVLNVDDGNTSLKFNQENNRVNIFFNEPLITNIQKNISISYAGIPADGLIIDTNKFKHRTFFADNWPNRAHNWIPCNDHPSDKASVEFIVTAPDHYQVIANGVLVEESNLSDHLKLSHWKEDMVLPTKVMVIALADFAVQLSGNIDCISVSSWVFPDNKDSGFAQYAISKNILAFYKNYIGPYPYKKLANVQSKTMFGGMENAGNIFYYENSVALNASELKHHRPLEDLFAHETAHQWFGDEASEIDWPHVWLSEGFATYMTHMYIEYKYGADSLRSRMKHDRQDIIDFSKKRKTPVVDSSASNNLFQLLNINSYQKGSWVLHTLRRKLGDSVFQKGIQMYYAAYKGANASTDDFRKIMENVSKENLQVFFKQWLYTPGQPVLHATWKYERNKKSITISIKQLQDFVFEFPLQIFLAAGALGAIKTIVIKDRNTSEKIPIAFEPKTVSLDPNVDLLFEGNIEKEK